MKLKQIEITEVSVNVPLLDSRIGGSTVGILGIVCNPCLNAGGVKEQHGRWMSLEFHQG